MVLGKKICSFHCLFLILGDIKSCSSGLKWIKFEKRFLTSGPVYIAWHTITGLIAYLTLLYTTEIATQDGHLLHLSRVMRFPKIVVCSTSKSSNQPAYPRSLIRAFASRLNIIWVLHHLDFLSLKGGCTGSSESTLVKLSYCRKLHVSLQKNMKDITLKIYVYIYTILRPHNSFTHKWK